MSTVAARAATTCASPSLSPTTPVAVQSNPQNVVFGDWNRDGDLDMAITNAGSNSVSIRLGDGSGGFPSGTDVMGLGNQPEGIASADFDGDGILDLVVAVRGANKVSFLKGTSAGGFVLQSANDISGLSGARGVVTGDFDRDGHPDFAVSLYPADRVAFFLSNGFGFTFTASGSPLLTGKLPIALAVGDFDRDGDLDVVSASEADSNVSFLQNNGLGGFSEPFARTPLAGGAFPRGIAAADLNGDGLLDVVSADSGTKTLTVLRGNGNGTFAVIGTLSTGNTTSSVAVADFDRDGVPDLVASSLGDDKVFVFLGKGTFAFDPPFTVAVAGAPLGVAAGDLNSDGKADVAVVESTGNQAAILLNDSGFACPNQSFTTAPRSSPASTNPRWVVKGDFNADGRLDVAVGNDLAGSPDSVTVLLGSGSTGLTPSGSFSTGPGTQLPVLLDAADFDGDGKLDVVTPNNQSNNISVLPGLGGGSLGAALVFSVNSGPISAVAGDFNGDGKPDIAVSNSVSNDISVFLNTGSPGSFSFTGPFNYPTPGSPSQVVAGDVNNDGKIDLVVGLASPTNKLAVLLGVGNGTFNSAFATPAGGMAGNGPFSLVLADFNDDFILDVATANNSSNDVSVLFGSGSGTFSEMILRPVGAGPQNITLGDFNGDGRPDIATANTSASTVSVILATGPGAFGLASTFSATAAPVGVTAGDFTADGQVDLVTSGSGPGTVLLFVGKGDGTFVTTSTFTTPNGPGATEVGDFNRDGKLDVVTANNSGSVTVLPGNGAGGFGVAITSPLAGNLRHAIPGDFDGDGILDVAVANLTSNQVQILKGNGGGGFSLLSSASAASSPVQLAVGDFDRDGDLDVAAALSGGQLAIYRNNSAGNIGGAPAFSIAVDTTPAGIVSGDFDKDGILDLAISHTGSNDVIVMKGSGAASLAFSTLSTVSLGAGASPRHLVAADFDDDGNLDLATANDGFNNVGFLRNNGFGTFAAPTFWTTGTRPAWIVAGDFNQDGVLDIATANITGDSVSVLTGGGGGTFASPVTYGVNGAAFSLAVGDFNRDGKPDLVAGNTIVNTVSVVLNSNCEARRLEVVQTPLCNVFNVPFISQPHLSLFDDGANPIRCDGNQVTAALVPGTGTAGAFLNGVKVIPVTMGATGGNADYNDLSIDKDGAGYRINFAHALSTVIPARTKPFTVGLDVDINGPATVCSGAPSTWSTLPPSFVFPPVYDKYAWSLSGSPVATTFGFTLGPQLPNSYVLQLDATLDSCTVTKTRPFTAEAPLSSVTINVAGSQTEICTTCTGASMSLTEAGGGGPVVSRQWGFRSTSGGAITSIAGQTGAVYTLFGGHFPSPGSYFVVETTSPTCGPSIVSNEVPVTIFSTTSGPQLPVFTARSKTTENHLQWLNPAGSAGTLVRVKVSTLGTSDCTFPVDPGDGLLVTLQPAVAGDPDAKLDSGLQNDTTYCYRAFVAIAPNVYAVPGKDLKARPFDSSGNVRWAFSTGVSTLSPPGMGQGVIHVVTNDGAVHSVMKGDLGGLWAPLPWKPPLMPLPSQASRPSAIPVNVGGVNPVLFLSSQDGHVYTYGAANGNGLWAPAPLLGDSVQAGPSGVFTTFGGTRDLIFVGSVNGATPNSFYGLRLTDGNPVAPGWTYSGGGGNGQIGIISGQAAVDYTAHRVYFASRSFGASLNTVWCVDFETGLALWAKPHNNISSGVTLRGNRLYVGLDGGGVMAIDTGSGNAAWSGVYPTPTTVKGFVYADRLSDDLYFSTASGLYSVSDDGGAPNGWTDNWGGPVALTNPSTPVFIPGDDKVYTGGVGRLFRRRITNGGVFDEFVLGDGAAFVGSPTIDLFGGFAYVGSSEGVVYAIRLP